MITELSNVEQGGVCHLSSVGTDGINHCRRMWVDSSWASPRHPRGCRPSRCSRPTGIWRWYSPGGVADLLLLPNCFLLRPDKGFLWPTGEFNRASRVFARIP